MSSPQWIELPDLAGRVLGGSVLAASDEFFADKENLIKPEPARFQAETFTPKGQQYDGWETRRRRGAPGSDWVLLRLGVPGVIRGAIVDTAHFLGNFPQRCELWGTAVDGYPTPAELATAEWEPLVRDSALAGGTRNAFEVDAPRRFTHVRLDIHPDGGVARLRLHGEPVPDPRDWAGLPLDLAATVNGGAVTSCSDSFFSPPSNLLRPGLSQRMGDGWETARRRTAGNDWAVIRLAGQAVAVVAELDTSHYRGNAPDHAVLSGMDSAADPADWFPLLPATRLQPDTSHRFRIAAPRPVTHVRIDIVPDGGLARLRLYGNLTAAGFQAALQRWYDLVPARQAEAALLAAGLPGSEAAALAARRGPVPDALG
jgi:allantoicase